MAAETRPLQDPALQSSADNAGKNAAATFELSRDELGRLVLVNADGTKHVGIVPLRMFPISAPDGQIVILNEQGRELLIVESLAGLSQKTAELLERELACREFVPLIQRIVSASGDTHLALWHVATDRGETDVQVHVDDGLRRLGSRGLLVVDVHGVRFLISDITQLDANSRRILQQYF